MFRKYFVKIFQLVSLFIVCSLVYFILGAKTTLATDLFEDNFNDSSETLLKWNIVGPSLWQFSNGMYGVLIDNGVTNALPSDQYWDSNWLNFVFTTDIFGVQGTDKNILIRFKDDLNYYEIHHTGGYIYLDKTVGGNGYHIAQQVSYPLNNLTPYYFRIEVNNNHFKVWESGNILFDVDDTPITFSGGKPGLRVGVGSIHPSEVWYDNVIITDLSFTPSPTPTLTPIPTSTPTLSPTPTFTPIPSPTPTPILLPSLDVPDIKQYDPGWANLVYDTANIWSPSRPFIKNWGCALTSASMILKYYGHRNANPDILNNWLISQPDGYIGNGLVNWIAITRYAKEHESETASALEYARLNSSYENLLNQIYISRPAIVKEPGHFIVAKSVIADSIGINDPGYSSRNSLLDYGNTFINLVSFIPSHTDLSYILITVNSKFNLKVFGADGNEISDHAYVEDPLVDDVGGIKKSGAPITIFELPKPDSGNYKVEITGVGPYILNTFIYNNDGNVTSFEKNGSLKKNQTESFNISVPEESSNSIIDSLIEDLDEFRSQGEIKNEFVYQLLKSQLIVIKGLIESGESKIAIVATKSVKIQIRIYTPRFITRNASRLLINGLDNLINFLKK